MAGIQHLSMRGTWRPPGGDPNSVPDRQAALVFTPPLP